METLGILGTGTMGAGIAQIAAQSGYGVLLWNRRQESIDKKALPGIQKSLARLLKKERIGQEDHDAALGRIRGTSTLEDLKTADLLIEAVPEDAELKHELYERLAGICSERVIFATNTSSLSVTELAEASGRPYRFVGMHFFNPVPAMKLVEIVSGLQTSEDTVQASSVLA